MKTPSFWNKKNLISFILLPLSCIYGILRFLHVLISKQYKGKSKIICIGNITAGGNGKTPTALEVGRIFKENNINFAYLSKGYKGSINHFTKVDLSKHTAKEVGDEPMLLANFNDTFVCKSRKTALKELSKNYNYEYIIMDDGFQNPTIYKDKNIIIIDGKYGIGNGFLLPSGPLRETFSSAIKRTDFVIMLGDDKQNITDKIKKYNKKIIFSQIKEIKNNININDKYIAFCGIGRPQKFFDSLKKAKYNVIKEISFEDHCEYNENILDNIFLTAKENNAKIITTEKDYVKIPLKYKKDIEVLKIKVEFNNIIELKELLLNDKN